MACVIIKKMQNDSVFHTVSSVSWINQPGIKILAIPCFGCFIAPHRPVGIQTIRKLTNEHFIYKVSGITNFGIINTAPTHRLCYILGLIKWNNDIRRWVILWVFLYAFGRISSSSFEQKLFFVFGVTKCGHDFEFIIVLSTLRIWIPALYLLIIQC